MKINHTLIALLLLTACSAKQQEAEKTEAPKPTPAQTSAQTAVAKEETPDAASGATNVAKHTSFNGILVVPPQKQVTVGLTMGGAVHTLHILPGQSVRRGAVLATLRNPEFIDLQQQFLEAAAQEEYLEKEYLRQERLSQEEAASRKRFEQSKADYQAMKARKSASAAQLILLGVAPDELISAGIRPYLEVKAPIDGYVTDMKLNAGSFVNTGEKLCDIVNKGDFMLCLTAYEKDLGELEAGRKIKFRVNGMGEEVFDAELVSVGQQIDEVSRSLDVYARVPVENSRFRPGMYVTARIEKN